MEDFMKILRADQQQRKQEQARMGEIIRQHTETVNRMALNLGYIARPIYTPVCKPVHEPVHEPDHEPVCKPVTELEALISYNLN